MLPFPLGRPSRPSTPSHPPGLPTRSRIDSSRHPTGPVQTQSSLAPTPTANQRSTAPHSIAQVSSRDESDGKGGRYARPETPLDFLHTMHRRVRSSMDSERLERALDAQLVDHPKGVPYAFPDDLSTGPAGTGSSTSLAKPAAGAGTGGHAHARRLGTFRENTRSKLASLSGFGRDTRSHTEGSATRDGHEERDTNGSAPYSASASANGSITTTTSPVKTFRPGMPERAASYATGQTLAHRPVAGPRHPSMYIPTTPGLTDDKSTITLDSASSVVDEHEHGRAEDITLSSSPIVYAPSLASTQSSTSHKRERVLGLTADDRDTSANETKAFVPQKVTDVVPFAEGHPFAAWDTSDTGGKTKRRLSVNMRRLVQVEEAAEAGTAINGTSLATQGVAGWQTDVKGKKTWTGDVGAYRVGWERSILDMEARVHETLWEVRESHTFADFAEGEEPKTVLDLGTGSGVWPISQALIWPQTTFVGLDIAPCQTVLDPLVESEARARSTSESVAQGEGMWEGVARRITWAQANFLDRLPYDDAVFDMVHIRFCGLGIPESKWYDLLEECARVLRQGGVLEIVEMAYSPPTTAPPSVRNAFASLLLADMIQPSPLLPLQFNLPACEGLKGQTRPTWEKTFLPGSGVNIFGEAAMGWVRSALGYKGTGLGMGGEGDRVLAELAATDPVWAVDGREGEDGHEGDAEGMAGEAGEAVQGTSVWAWVVTRR